MRRLFIQAAIALVLTVPLARLCAGQYLYNFKTEKQMMKTRQKQERKNLKRQQGNEKKSWKRTNVSKATRSQARHQMKRERRNLHQQQHDERQDLKDRERVMKERAKQYSFR